MPDSATCSTTRILVIDDNRAIHEDLRRILEPADMLRGRALAEAEALLFGAAPPAAVAASPFALDSAYQGRAGRDLLRRALEEGRPYALAFVDVRMPPGWDGIQTIARLWEEDALLQAVICTAYSDYSWNDVIAQLGETDRLLILKKPFDPIEVRQLACALALRSRLTQESRSKLRTREHLVAERTRPGQPTSAARRRLNKERTGAIFTPGPAGERQGPAVRD
jgi:CheY-like chemotaxis protein